MRKVSVLRKILSGLFVLFVLWGLGPIIIELLTKTINTDSLGLTILLISVSVIAFFSLILWLPAEQVNTTLWIKWLTIILFIIATLAIFIFVYSNWMLLVVFLAVDYVWIKRLLKGEMETATNLTSLTVVSFLLAIYVFFVLVY